MSFVVEKISEQDFYKSGLREYSGKYFEWKSGREWVIDRERNIFVIKIEKTPNSKCNFLGWVSTDLVAV